MLGPGCQKIPNKFVQAAPLKSLDSGREGEREGGEREDQGGEEEEESGEEERGGGGEREG